MKFFFDTEFREDGKIIDLISIGIIDENNREYYAISKEFDLEAAYMVKWLRDNVLIHLYKELETDRKKNPFSLKRLTELVEEFGKTRNEIKAEIIEYLGENPEMYANHASYDWVVFCQLFGTMMKLPKSYPRYCRDLKQTHDEYTEKYNLADDWEEKNCPEPKNAHNALADARWNKLYYDKLMQVSLRHQ